LGARQPEPDGSLQRAQVAQQLADDLLTAGPDGDDQEDGGVGERASTACDATIGPGVRGSVMVGSLRPRGTG